VTLRGAGGGGATVSPNDTWGKEGSTNFF
jgi:hypothetical protein